MRYYFLSFIFILIFSISGFAQDISKTKVVLLEVGSRHNIGSNLVRLSNGEEYFQIIDISVNKTMQLISVDGIKKLSVDISKVLRKVERFGGIHCISQDKFLITDNNNSAFIFDSQGFVTDSLDLNSILSKHLNGSKCVFVKPKIHNNKLYVIPLWVGSTKNTSTDMRKLMVNDFKQFLTIHSEMSSQLPLMYEIDLSSKTSKPIFKDYYKTFFNNGDFIPTNHFPTVDFSTEHLFVSSVYGNKLCKFNLITGKKELKEISHTIELNGLPINIHNPQLTLSPDEVYRKFARNYLMEEAYIMRLVVDPHKELVYLLMKHEFENEEGNDLRRDYRFGKKTLLALDMNMTVIAQKSFSNKEYSGVLWATKSGLAMSMKNPNVKHYDPTVSRIQLFEIHK